MASVDKQTDVDGKARAWKVRYRTPAGTERARTFRRKGDADRFKVEVEASRLSGLFLDDRRGRMTVAAYGAEWRAGLAHQANTARRVEIAFRVHIDPYLGDRQLVSVRPSDLRAWLKSRSSVLAASTLRVHWSYVRSMFKAAVADRAIPFSPCDGVRPERAETARVRPVTVEEIHAIVERLPARWRALGLVAAQTGLRRGELLGLAVGQIDFLRRTITVDRQWRDGAIVAELKSSTSRRVVPIDQVTVEVLAAHLAAFPAGPGGLVFANRDGVRPLTGREVSKYWRRAVGRAGIGRPVSVKEMRHFYASALIAAGRPVTEVQARLGHAHASITLDVYSHLFESDQDRSRGVLDAVFSAGVSSACPGFGPRASDLGK